jgi:hypothetical protein
MSEPLTETPPVRAIRCRVLDETKRGSIDRCTNEAVDPNAELLICVPHLAAALRMIQSRAAL